MRFKRVHGKLVPSVVSQQVTWTLEQGCLTLIAMHTKSLASYWNKSTFGTHQWAHIWEAILMVGNLGPQVALIGWTLVDRKLMYIVHVCSLSFANAIA